LPEQSATTVTILQIHYIKHASIYLGN